MTFSTLEISRQRGQPVTLYKFTSGNAVAYAYTDAEQSVTFDGNTYSPVPVIRDSVSSSGTLDKSSLAVRFPKDIGLSTDFQVYPPVNIMSLIIYQGHYNDADVDFLVIWSGRVLSVGREGNECVISGEPFSSSLRRPGLRRHYQLGCPHILYGTSCNASEAAATVSATVASTSGLDVILNAGWEGAFAAAKFLDGMVKWTNDDGGEEVRRILSISGNTLSLSGYLRDLVATDTVSVILGCNHQMSDCLDLHNNINNFGGCPWIPTKNPVGTRNNFY